MDVADFVKCREAFDSLEREICDLIGAKDTEQAAAKLEGARSAFGNLAELMTESEVQQRVVENRQTVLQRLERDVASAQTKYAKKRKSKKRVPTWTLDETIAFFLQTYPQGFADPQYIEKERQSKDEAHAQFVAAFGNGQAQALLSKGAVDEIIQRFLDVFLSKEKRGIGLSLLSPYEKAALTEALNATEPATRYLQALFAVVEEEVLMEETYTAYTEAVAALPAPKGRVATWPVLTLAPYIGQPARHMFLKPEITKVTAARLEFDLQYSPTLSYATYRKLIEMSMQLRDALEAHGARDFIDVQSFIWITGSYREEADKSAEASEEAGT